MKKMILFPAILVLLAASGGPEKLTWHSLSEGVELARKENKAVLFFLYASWCDMSKRMEKKVLNDKEVAALLSENFILVRLDVEKDTSYLHNDKILDRKVFLEEVSPGKYQLGVPTTVLYREQDSGHVFLKGMQDPGEFKKSIAGFLHK